MPQLWFHKMFSPSCMGLAPPGFPPASGYYFSASFSALFSLSAPEWDSPGVSFLPFWLSHSLDELIPSYGFKYHSMNTVASTYHQPTALTMSSTLHLHRVSHRHQKTTAISLISMSSCPNLLFLDTSFSKWYQLSPQTLESPLNWDPTSPS